MMSDDDIRVLYHKHNLAEAGLVVSDLKLIVSDVVAAEREPFAEELAQLRAEVRRYRDQAHRSVNEVGFGA
jgi:hypothetical protein